MLLEELLPDSADFQEIKLVKNEMHLSDLILSDIPNRAKLIEIKVNRYVHDVLPDEDYINKFNRRYTLINDSIIFHHKGNQPGSIKFLHDRKKNYIEIKFQRMDVTVIY